MSTCDNFDRTVIALHQSLHHRMGLCHSVERGKMFAIQTSPCLSTDFSAMGGLSPFKMCLVILQVLICEIPELAPLLGIGW